MPLCHAFQLTRASSMSFLPVVKEEAEESSVKSEVSKKELAFSIITEQVNFIIF